MNATVRSEEAAPYLTTPELDAVVDRGMEDNLIARALDIIDGRFKRGEAFTTPDAAGTYAKLQLAARPNETFLALFLDTRHKLLACEELFHGTVDGAEVHPRVIAQRALHHNAAAVIVAHNHPSGSAEPSAADRAVTARLKQALALIDVRLLDHFVCGEGKPVSLASRGWI